MITVYSFWRSRHTLWRARRQILPLIWLNFAVLSTWPNLPTGVAAWPLLSLLFVSGVLGLQIRRGQIRWKANTSGYNFYGGPSLNSVVFKSKIPPGNRAASLPCFANGESISNSSVTAMPSLYSWHSHLILCPLKVTCTKLIN